MADLRKGNAGFSALELLGLRDTFGITTGTGTAVTNAVTINAKAGVITTEALTTAGGGNQAITLTNSKISVGDMIFVQVAGGTNTVQNITFKATAAAGSATITVYNNTAATALNGTIILNFYVIKV